MKYIKEVESALREVIYEDWMDENDYNNILIEIYTLTGITPESLSNDIEVGVKNGMPLEYQLTLFREILKGI